MGKGLFRRSWILDAPVNILPARTLSLWWDIHSEYTGFPLNLASLWLICYQITTKKGNKFHVVTHTVQSFLTFLTFILCLWVSNEDSTIRSYTQFHPGQSPNCYCSPPSRPKFYAKDIFPNCRFQRIAFPLQKALTFTSSQYHPCLRTFSQENTYRFRSHFTSLDVLASCSFLLAQKKEIKIMIINKAKPGSFGAP